MRLHKILIHVKITLQLQKNQMKMVVMIQAGMSILAKVIDWIAVFFSLPFFENPIYQINLRRSNYAH